MQATSLDNATASARSSAGLTDAVDLAARVALAAIFIWSGADKLFFHTAQTAGYMAAYHVPFASALVYPVGLVEFVGGILLAVGYRTKAAAAALALFTVAATAVFHAFWAVPADQALMQSIHFMKNLAILGGLLHVIAYGSGRLALQRA